MIRTKEIWAVILFSMLLPLLSFSQDSGLGNWMIYIGNKKVNPKWNIHHEIQYRNYKAIGDLEQLLLRSGLGYNVSDKNNVLLGYGFIRSENYAGNSDDKFVVNEHRIFQQFINKHKLKRISFQHRFRFEQRFVEDLFKLRLRYFLGMTMPLNNKEMTSKTYYLSMYNELFVNTKDNAFDRHRLYGGLGYKINGNIRIELGYMNQFFKAGGRDQLNLIIFGQF